MNSRVLVVVPAWNEEASIANVVNDLVRHSFDVLVVDDGSTDLTYSRAQQAGATVVRLPFGRDISRAQGRAASIVRLAAIALVGPIATMYALSSTFSPFLYFKF